MSGSKQSRKWMRLKALRDSGQLTKDEMKRISSRNGGTQYPSSGKRLTKKQVCSCLGNLLQRSEALCCKACTQEVYDRLEKKRRGINALRFKEQKEDND